MRCLTCSFKFEVLWGKFSCFFLVKGVCWSVNISLSCNGVYGSLRLQDFAFLKGVLIWFNWLQENSSLENCPPDKCNLENSPLPKILPEIFLPRKTAQRNIDPYWICPLGDFPPVTSNILLCILIYSTLYKL